jgi:hypothetical protein
MYQVFKHSFLYHTKYITKKKNDSKNESMKNTYVLAGKMQSFLNTLRSREGYFMYHQFNIQQFCNLPIECIYVFCMDLRTNSDYFPIQY